MFVRIASRLFVIVPKTGPGVKATTIAVSKTSAEFMAQKTSVQLTNIHIDDVEISGVQEGMRVDR